MYEQATGNHSGTPDEPERPGRAMSLDTILIHRLLHPTGGNPQSPEGRDFVYPLRLAHRIERQRRCLKRRLRGWRAGRTLRSRLLVSIIRHREASFVCVGCVDSELDHVRGLDVRMMTALRAAWLEYLPLRRRLPRIAVYFFGREVDFATVPAGLAGFLDDERHRAYWNQEHNAVVMSMKPYQTLRDVERVWLHELTHAFKGLATEGYWWFPAAIEEALAIAMEVRFFHDRAIDLPECLAVDQVPPGRRHAVKDEYWSVHELLTRTREDEPLRRSFCHGAYSLLCCLALMNNHTGYLRGLLLTACREWIQPEDWVEWLPAKLGVSLQCLEDVYRTFWLTGVLPDEFRSGAHQQ